MLKNESESLYDQFPDCEAPVSRRQQNWQAAPKKQAKANEAYKVVLPPHVAEAMTVHQKDNGYYEFQKFAFGHPPIDSFGGQVNKAFGAIDRAASFIDERERYRSLYKRMMNEE